MIRALHWNVENCAKRWMLPMPTKSTLARSRASSSTAWTVCCRVKFGADICERGLNQQLFFFSWHGLCQVENEPRVYQMSTCVECMMLEVACWFRSTCPSVGGAPAVTQGWARWHHRATIYKGARGAARNFKTSLRHFVFLLWDMQPG